MEIVLLPPQANCENKKFLSLPAVIQLMHAFVLSHIYYDNALLVGLPATRLAKL